VMRLSISILIFEKVDYNSLTKSKHVYIRQMLSLSGPK
jgi:hypothetical protein